MENGIFLQNVPNLLCEVSKTHLQAEKVRKSQKNQLLMQLKNRSKTRLNF